MNNDKLFEDLAAAFPEPAGRTPASLQARLYTALVREQAASGPLAALGESKASGRGLCVFEELVHISPAGQKAQQAFYCSVCHARILAEHFDNPPIWWPNCPYAEFKKG